MTLSATCAIVEVSHNPSYYRGEQYDSDLGLYYLRARYYNPLTGRFMSRDPKDGESAEPATLHRYLYASGNPVNALDPSGRGAIGDFVLTVWRSSITQTIVYAARVVCYVEGLTILTAEFISLAVKQHFFSPGLPWPYFALPCIAVGLPFPPKPPAGLM